MLFKLLQFVAISAVVTLVIALVLIATNRPSVMPDREGLDFSNQLKQKDKPLPVQTLDMSDGWAMPYRKLDGPDGAPLLVLVHGSGWYGAQFDGMARVLSAHATVLVPDLRGHGPTPWKRGDISYIGQFEDDLAALILAERKPDQDVVLAGHSSGGGLVVRFAGGEHGDLMDRAILLAPFLKYNAPTARQNAGGWSQTLVRRMIGLSMLNGVGITALNYLPVIQFSMPKQVLEGPLGANATTMYSYRLNTSFAPRNDYEKDMAALPEFLLIAGTKDEAFFAEEYEPLMSKSNPNGQYHLVTGASHLDVINLAETTDVMGRFLDDKG